MQPFVHLLLVLPRFIAYRILIMLRKVQNLSPVERTELIAYLRSFKWDERLHTYDKVLDKRTRYLTILMENMDHPHNVSAVLRSCECFGIQEVHLVDDADVYGVNKKVAKGSSKWLDLTKYSRYHNNTEEALKQLKNRGYRLVATTPAQSAVSIDEFDILKGKTAFIFGTELTGISSTVIEQADEFISIPTVGFTESLNLSVSVAIILHSMTSRLYKSGIEFGFSNEEKEIVMLDWLRKTIPKVDLIEKRFFDSRSQG